jgi:hypothetical protein
VPKSAAFYPDVAPCSALGVVDHKSSDLWLDILHLIFHPWSNFPFDGTIHFNDLNEIALFFGTMEVQSGRGPKEEREVSRSIAVHLDSEELTKHSTKVQKIPRNRKRETRSANQQYLAAVPVDQQSGNQPIFHPEQVSATAKHAARYLVVLLSHS